MKIFNKVMCKYIKLNALITSIMLLLLVCFNSVTAQAQNYTDPTQVSGQMVTFGDVIQNGFIISPDGSRVVYIADQITDGVNELFSAPIDGSAAPVRLNTTLVSGGRVISFTISEDSNQVVYRADQNTDRVNELFSVPIDGSRPPVRLNSNLPLEGDVSSFLISEDSSRIVYQADQNTDGVDELFSVPIDGSSAVVRLNSNLVSGGDVVFFSISPDSNRVIYIADQTVDGRQELFSVLIDGSSAVPTRLNPDLSNSGGGVFDVNISFDSSRVIYLSNHNNVNIGDIFSVPITGGTPIQLSTDLSAGSFVDQFRISPDSSRVVFIADQMAGDVHELFSVPILGGMPIRLNPNLSAAGSDVAFFEISANSNQVVYSADQVTDGLDELFSVPIDGSATALRLNSGLAASLGFTLNDDGSQVVFRRQQFILGQLTNELFSIPTNGNATAPTSLNSGRTDRSSITPDGNHVIYIADQNTDDVFELFAVPITGGTPERLNDDLPFGSNVLNFRVSSNGDVVYFSDQDVFDEDELFSVQLIQEDDELCFPIKASNGNVAVVCL